uniref:Ground-like domain-containing protein n=1 Tax=Elaeophora elaphi TaxID=1147741 RepID=A0A0R3RU50_9BILA
MWRCPKRITQHLIFSQWIFSTAPPQTCCSSNNSNEKLISPMLIFVILSTADAYFSKSPQPQLPSHPSYHRSRTLLCRLPTPPHTVIFCSRTLLSCPPTKPLLRPPLYPLCRPALLHPLLPSCPIICPPSLPRPPSPVSSCPSSCPPSTPSSSPSPPSASPPQHYDSIRPIISNPTKLASYSYSDGIPESYQGSYKGELPDDDDLTDDLEDVTGSTHSLFPEKPELIPFDQQFNTNITHINASFPSQQQPPQAAVSGEDEIVTEAAKNVKYLIKTNCSSNHSNCVDDFTLPPENDCCTNCPAPCHFRYIRKTSLRSDQIQEIDPQLDDDINKSKIRIERTARWFLGGLFGVICGNNNFGYIVHTKDFCQHRKGNVTCYVFRSQLDYSKINIP